ncbi:MAG: peptidylprolyl isomerase, partial [Clostridia bacterium]|nr:peptidylprolyl isomerase [Clostridia bacterium]
WVYSKDRKAGDKTLIKDGASAYIIIIDKPAYVSNSVTFRHIKIDVQAEDAENIADAEKKEAKKTADSVLKEWKDGDKTEETFSDLANKDSSDSETNTIGGLVENYRISTGGYNDEFNEWIFSADRKKGDTKIIKADDDGYEIVYFVSNNKDDIDQYDTIRTKMASDKVEENEKALLADDGKYVADVNEKVTISVMKKFCKTIRSNIAYQNRQQ